MKNLYIYNLCVKNDIQNEFHFLEEYPYRSAISVELNSHFCMGVLL